MKLAAKLTLALTIGIAAIMGGYAYLQVRREVTLFEAELAKDQRIMGRALRTAVEAIWESEGEGRALKLVDEANEAQQEVRIRWVWLEAPHGEQGQPAAPMEILGVVMSGRATTIIRPDDTGEERRYTYVPVSVSGSQRGALELSESLASQRTYIRRSELDTLLTTLVIVAVCSGVAMGLGFWFVGRPMRRLYEKARRVGEGDLSGRLVLRQRDEIGQLAEEINLMCDRLAEANRRVASETEARISTLEQLRHADRLKTVGQLASGIAHELGTPLNVISARAKMIAVGEVAGDEIAESAHVIAEYSERIAAIIRKLLDFSRRRGPKLGVGDLRHVAAQTVAMLSSMAEKRLVTLSLEADQDAMPVHVDQNQMQQALANLVLNGIQAMPRGGRLRVGISRRLARPPADHSGGEGIYLCVTVEDEGEGIPQDRIPRIFEPFFTTKGVGEGTGLGLSVAHGIVCDHGGWIAVESDVGKGSRFMIFLSHAGIREPLTQEAAS